MGVPPAPVSSLEMLHGVPTTPRTLSLTKLCQCLHPGAGGKEWKISRIAAQDNRKHETFLFLLARQMQLQESCAPC